MIPVRSRLTAAIAAASIAAPFTAADAAVSHSGPRAHRAQHRQHVRHVIAPYRGWLARVRWCESTNRYAINTGNGFYGAYQFTLSSWAAVGGHGYPHLAPPLWQDYRAVRLLHLQGRGAWPVCG